MLGDDPPYLSVGTEVSAKYKGAFCEAKIRKVVRSVKCRVTYKQGLGTATVTDDQIKGTLRVGASVEARHVDKKEFVEATITKIQDCSQYTVVFDDGDITTLRRTALCLKSGRHFAESETLDQLPLTHPEHFGNPVIGGRRGRRSRQAQDDSSEDEGSPPRGSPSGSGLGGKEGAETEPEIGRVVCVELGDKKKKDNWFPGLVVAPTAQDTVRIRVRDDYLVRSFKDARYYTVPKKEATEFTKELGTKVENSVLKDAVTKALNFLEKNELPPHWDRDSLFGNSMSSGNSDTDGDLDSDSSDDEPREEKDHFVAQLYKFMDDRGTPINNCPMIGNEDIDLYRLFRAVEKLGGYNRVTNQNQWKSITRRLGISMQPTQATHNLVKQAYKKFLHSFEDFYRKLGCTMVNHPRGSTRKQRPGRSLIRDKDRNTPVPTAHQNIPKTEKEKAEGDEEQKEKKISGDEEKSVGSEPSVPRDIVKEEEPKPIKKKEVVEESASGQESDINVEAESTESSSSEKSQKPPARFTPVSLSRAKSSTTPSTTVTTSTVTAATPSATTTTTTTTAKNKEESKKKTYEKKKQEGNSSSSSSGTSVTGKKETSKKDEETTKTRSKSKEDTKVKDSRETRTPSRESEKTRANSLKPRRLTDDEIKKQQRGRKKREDTEKSRVDKDESSGAESSSAPCYKGPVQLGDRLKVYYGPTHESKVTYEAKVIGVEPLDGSEEMNYLVHYTGWNTRYDEWIKAARIAQNFTQSQARVRRTKATPRPQTPSTNSSKSVKTPTTGLQGRRRAQSVAPTTSKTCSSTTSTSSSASSVNNKDKDSSQPARSTTPLSVNSSSSRTKSPATPAGSRPTRNTRNAEHLGIELRRRTRRMSGHTDLSVVTESEDSDAYETDTTEPERARTRSRGTEERRRREVRRRVEDRIKPDENSEVEDEKDAVNEPRRTRRLRRTPNKIQSKSEVDSGGAAADDDEDDVEDEENDENDDDDEEENQVPDTFERTQPGHDEQPKGRDFDLNQIRSELKGFDKAVKMEVLRVEPENSGDEDTKPRVEDLQKEMKDEKKKKDIKVEESGDFKPTIEALAIKTDQSPSPTEDVYEFKEPEPFEFEVRNKRDSSGDKDKPKKRVFDEEPKSPKKKQKTSAASPKEIKSETEVDTKRKARRTPVKRTEDTLEVIKPTVIPTPKEFEKVIEPPTLIPSKAAPVTLSPPTLVSAVIEEQTKSNSNMELFTDSTSNDDGVGDADDPEDRLIISETDVTETDNENLPTTYQHDVLSSAETSNKNEFSKQVEGNKDKEEKHVSSNVPGTSGMPVITPSVSSLPLSEDNRVVYEQKQWIMKPMNYKNPWGNEIKPPLVPPPPPAFDKKVIDVKPPVIERKVIDTKPPTIERKVIDVKPPTLPVITPSASSVPPSNSEQQVIFEPKQWIMKYIFNQKQPGNETKPSVIEKRTSDNKSPLNDKQLVDIKPPTIASLATTTLPSPIVLAPISARLPATSTIEEKLSAAAMAFRQSKPRDSKRDDDSSESKKNPKDSSKKADTHGKRSRVTNDEQAKLKQELERKKEQEALKIQEERSRDAIRATLKQKEDELEQLKMHKEDLKKIVDVKNEQRKIVDKREDMWKKKDKVDMMDVDIPKEISCEPKENEKQKRKKVISQEFVDSTDSSDSEQKLVIDNSEVKEERHESSDFEVKVKPEMELYAESRSDRHQQVSSLIVHQEQSINTSKNIMSVKTEEEGENMNLLCEEEIPGSPAPVIDTTEQERPGNHHHHHHHTLIKNESNEKKLVLLEMPFASAPALGPQSSSTSQGSMSMTVTTACNVPVPVLIPMQPNVVTTARQPPPLQHHHHQPLQQPQPQLQSSQQQPLQKQEHQQQPVIIPQPLPEQLPPPIVHQVIQPPRRESNEAAPVMDNTPPTTPDSTISNISTSPRGDERTGGSSPLSDENIKLNRDTSEADNDSAGKAPSGYSEDDGTLNNDGNLAERGSSKAMKRSAEDPASPKKKKRSRKSSECGSNGGRKTSGRHSARQTRQSSAAGSDSDDTSEGSSSATNNINNNTSTTTNSSSSTDVIETTTASTTTAITNGITDLNSISSRSPKPMKYNFYVELDPQLDGSQRIALLQQKLTELKNTYNTVKLELAAIERRRKKLRRREREAMKAAKAEMQQACS